MYNLLDSKDPTEKLFGLLELNNQLISRISEEVRYEPVPYQGFGNGGTFQRLFVSRTDAHPIRSSASSSRIDHETSYTALFSHNSRPAMKDMMVDSDRYTKFVSQFHKDIDTPELLSEEAIEMFDSLPEDVRMRILDIHEHLTGQRAGGYHEFMISILEYIDELKEEVFDISKRVNGKNVNMEKTHLNQFFNLIVYWIDHSLVKNGKDINWWVVRALIISLLKG